MQRGYIKIWRKLEDSGLLQMPETLATMLFLILHATHKATKRGTKYGVIELERGQGILAIRVLAKDMKLSIQSIRTILVRLEKMEILTLKPTHAFSVYTIVNYNKYNDVPEQPTHEPTNQQHASNTPPTQEQALKHLSIKEETHTTRISSLSKLLDRGVNDEIARDWLIIRKTKKLPLTDTAIKQVEAEAKIAGLSFGEAVAVAVRNGWAGYKAAWEDKSSVEPTMLVCPNGFPFSEWMKLDNSGKAEVIARNR